MKRHADADAVFNRDAFLAHHSLSEVDGLALDRIVSEAGGRVHSVPAPPDRTAQQRRRPQPLTDVWEVPLVWLNEE